MRELIGILLFAACGGANEPRLSAETFHLVNQATTARYLDSFGLGVMLIRGTEALKSALDSCQFTCDHACTGCAADAELPSVKRLNPGESADLTWDGHYYNVVTMSCGACFDAHSAAPGLLAVQVTYSDSFSSLASGSGSIIGVPKTASTAFQHPAGTVIEVDLE
jgi:hypothetical protein